MFFQKDTTLIDGALINSAIQLLIRCFSNPRNKGRGCLNSNEVFRTYKMHWAAHGQTAAEKIYYSADADKPYMGMLRS